jgi:hypothetical protein
MRVKSAVRTDPAMYKQVTEALLPQAMAVFFDAIVGYADAHPDELSEPTDHMLIAEEQLYLRVTRLWNDLANQGRFLDEVEAEILARWPEPSERGREWRIRR